LQDLLRKIGTGGWMLIASLATGLAFADAAPPDIVGMRAGVSAQEAYSFLKAYDRVAKITVGLTPMPQASDKPLPYAFLLAQDGTSSAEMIEADLTCRRASSRSGESFASCGLPPARRRRTRT
jgi:hypothetical protein